MIYKLTSALLKGGYSPVRAGLRWFLLECYVATLLASEGTWAISQFFFFFCFRDRTINKESFSCSIHVQWNMAVFVLKHTYSAHSFSSHFTWTLEHTILPYNRHSF